MADDRQEFRFYMNGGKVLTVEVWFNHFRFAGSVKITGAEYVESTHEVAGVEKPVVAKIYSASDSDFMEIKVNEHDWLRAGHGPHAGLGIKGNRESDDMKVIAFGPECIEGIVLGNLPKKIPVSV